VKINTIIYFTDNRGQYGYMNCPGEILDISVPQRYDPKTKLMKDNKIKYAKYYKNDSGRKVNYMSYDLRGLLFDFIIQFKEAEQIWLIQKNEKKIKRFSFFLNLLLSQYDETKYREIKLKLIDRINKQNFQQDFHEDYINLFLGVLNENKTSDLSNQNTTKLGEEIKKIVDDLNSFKYIPNNIKDNVELTYMMKYLKYKNKFLELKKK
jgi:hypothetical protein